MLTGRRCKPSKSKLFEDRPITGRAKSINLQIRLIENILRMWQIPNSKQ